MTADGVDGRAMTGAVSGSGAGNGSVSVLSSLDHTRAKVLARFFLAGLFHQVRVMAR